MALILNIDTATEKASVAITKNGQSIGLKENGQQREHASFLHEAIKELFDETGNRLVDIDAVAVTSGPGSYTGLRVGMASAKGFCYALSKPMIAIGTLEAMTLAAIGLTESSNLYCPMIDARRMEVFTGLFNQKLEVVLNPGPAILDKSFLTEYLDEHIIYFFGSGSDKWKALVNHRNARFLDVMADASHLGLLAEKAFKEKVFTDVSYSVPNYLKNFHFVAK